MKIFTLFMMMMSLLFLNLINPLMMSMILFMQTLFLMMLLGKIYYSFWFSYIIFLIFIGGLLILFTYTITLTYNNMNLFIMNKNTYMMYSIIVIMFFFMKKNMMTNNNEMNIFYNKFNINNEYIMISLKFYNFPNIYINLMLIFYLFIMMLFLTKIINFYKGPIRIFK